ncbi:hypothetical protein D1970_00665 [Mesobacillus zeae]|uniref:SAM-dependent methyltransferase n=2 Tax=Mesobacillus zeae TaxID=1917180 RepID=A0A398BFJ4_9BACI|nr:hypothetical protein D1970_00665 [Mesobacillus zeae]
MNVRESYVRECTETVHMLAKEYLTSPFNVLEMFAGSGSIYTKGFVDFSEKIIGYELNKELQAAFEQNITNGQFIQANSIEKLMNDEFQRDLIDSNINIISIDNPLGQYNGDFFENFQIMDHIKNVIPLNQKSILCLNLVKTPYHPERHGEWINRRSEFFRDNGLNVNLDAAVNTYISLLELQEIKILDYRAVLREKHEGIDYYYMLFVVVEG